MTMRLANPFAGLESIVQENHPLAPHTWYRIGGPARYFVTPTSVEELQEAARRCTDNGIPAYVLGLGANLLVGDDGVDGAVFSLSAEAFRKVSIDGTTVTASAGADLQRLVVQTCREGLSGIETLAGIPGTLGGGIRMNAGGKFGDIGAVVKTVDVMDSNGNLFQRTKDDLVFDYRSTNISAPFILSATLDLERDDPETISKRTKEIWMYKRNSQPLNTKNCGCIFKNPRGLSAGALIDQAGLKGFRVGGAEVSAKHANFIVAHPGCRAEDVLKLMKLIREKVWDKNQLHLESEVKIWP
jgi:UDP-N-acetylmuramate dehydrogenase